MSGGLAGLGRLFGFGSREGKTGGGVGEQPAHGRTSSAATGEAHNPVPSQPPTPEPGWPPSWFALMHGIDDPPETIPGPRYTGRTTLPDAGWAGLTEETREAFNKLKAACLETSLKIELDEGYRPRRRQAYLYSLGRELQPDGSWKLLNASARRTNALPGESKHQSRRAFDVTVNGGYRESLLLRVGQIAEEQGLTWGGRWTDFRDSDHFQMDKET